MDESKKDRFQIEIDKMSISDNESVYELIRDITEPITSAIHDKVNEILRNRIIPKILMQFQEIIKNLAKTLNQLDIQELEI